MSDREKDYAPLSIACVRGLCDKLYEKRKTAGQEIEKMVRDFVEANNTNQIQRLIKVLSEDLMASTNPNVKIGALLGLSSVGVGLGKACGDWLEALLPPLLANCGESPRVRYHALEAIFNISKVCRGALVPHVPALLEVLVRLGSDPEPQVAHAAELLDRLLKEVVCGADGGCGTVEWSAWAAALRAALEARGGAALAVGWLAALEAAHAPALSLAPALLDPLLRATTHPDPDLRRMCEVQLAALLRGVAAAAAAAAGGVLAALLPALTAHAQAAAHPRTQLTALQWLAALVPSELEAGDGEGQAEVEEGQAGGSGGQTGGREGQTGGREGQTGGEMEQKGAGAAALAALPGLLAAALPPLAYSDEARRESREAAVALDAKLQALLASATPEQLDVLVEWGGCVSTLERLVCRGGGMGGVGGAALEWLRTLYARVPTRMRTHTARLYPAVLRAVAGDEASRAVRLLADMATHEPQSSEYYGKFLDGVLQLLADEPALLEERGAFIIRQVVRAGGTLEALGARAAASLAPLLSELLLCASELRPARDQLRAFSTQEAQTLFLVLWRGWTASPVSLCALCLLTRHYTLAARLLQHVGSIEVSVELLTEVDRLVQLLESPIFAFLRLELAAGGGCVQTGTQTDTHTHAQTGTGSSCSLRAALSALLALLPQGDAFHTLRRRLKAHPPAHSCVSWKVTSNRRSVDENALMQEFLQYHKLAETDK